MILYTLKCAKDHRFEAWFRNSEAYETQLAEGQVTCAVCGTSEVAKDVMAPALGKSAGKSAGKTAAVQEAAERPLSTPANPAEAMLAEMRRHIEKTADYVGEEFASEARRIHEGESDERPIWGEATIADAKSLADDGIKVAPIPFMRRRDA